MAAPTLVKSMKVFGGMLSQYKHASTACKTEMKFAIWLPAGAKADIPVCLVTRTCLLAEPFYFVHHRSPIALSASPRGRWLTGFLV